MLRRKEWVHSRCPCCGEVDETTHHVQQCKDDRCRAQWKKSLAGLKQWMIEVDTDVTIRSTILRTLEAWVQDNPLEPSMDTSLRSSRALNAQIALGGWNTLLGRISNQMTDMQDRKYKWLRSRRSGFRWTVAIVKKLQDVAWDMWDHRNGILHGDPDCHHRKGELEEANANIQREWQRGDAGLLQEDRFLFRNQQQIMARTLDLKVQWLATVVGARAAADAAARANDSYGMERQGMRNILVG